jgi:hypothetical protein
VVECPVLLCFWSSVPLVSTGFQRFLRTWVYKSRCYEEDRVHMLALSNSGHYPGNTCSIFVFIIFSFSLIALPLYFICKLIYQWFHLSMEHSTYYSNSMYTFAVLF